MASYPDFNLGTWQQRYNNGFESNPIGSFYPPLPPVVVPYSFVEQYIRILITSDTATPSWKRAAKLYQTIPTFLSNFDVIDIKSISLNKPEIFDFTQYADGYKLRLEFFSWFKDVDVLIHAWRSNIS